MFKTGREYSSSLFFDFFKILDEIFESTIARHVIGYESPREFFHPLPTIVPQLGVLFMSFHLQGAKAFDLNFLSSISALLSCNSSSAWFSGCSGCLYLYLNFLKIFDCFAVAFWLLCPISFSEGDGEGRDSASCNPNEM